MALATIWMRYEGHHGRHNASSVMAADVRPCCPSIDLALQVTCCPDLGGQRMYKEVLILQTWAGMIVKIASVHNAGRGNAYTSSCMHVRRMQTRESGYKRGPVGSCAALLPPPC